MELTLKKGSLTAEVTTMGGELVSLRDGGGLEYIWRGDEAYWSGRNPVLFPIVGRLKDGKAMSGAGLCEMPQHGVARKREFALAERGEDFAEFRLVSDGETLRQYPYAFDLRVRHTLTEQGFVTKFIVRNPGDVPMPFCIGAHTAFNCPVGEGEDFEEYALVFSQVEDADTVLVGESGYLAHAPGEEVLHGTDTIPLRYEVFDRRDTLIFDGLSSETVKLVNQRTGRGVEMDISQFPMVAFWTPQEKQAPFICIEPWRGCAAYEDDSGRFEEKPWCAVLAPGETWEAAYAVRILK